MAVTSPRDVVIIGANIAGVNAAVELRRSGYDGSITLLERERQLPYSRPPLSKDALVSTSAPLPIELYPESFYTDQCIDLRLGSTVSKIDTLTSSVSLADETRVKADTIILATGSRARKLNGIPTEIDGILYLRTFQDAHCIWKHLIPGKRLVIIGAGTIGCEVAFSAISRNVDVTLVEAGSRPLQRLVDEGISSFIARQLRRAGVNLILGRQLKRLHGTSRIDRAELDDGSMINADTILIATGAAPELELAQTANLATANGIRVDKACRTSSERVWAIGDVACQYRNGTSGGFIRLETESNAMQHAKIAAGSVLGLEVPQQTTPWGWTDLGHDKLQYCGDIVSPMEIVVRGEFGSNSFSVFHVRNSKVAGSISVNDPRTALISRKIITSQQTIESAELADISLDMRDLLTAST